MSELFEAQEEQEVLQIRSRELQLENTEKLNNIIPVVESLNEVNLAQIESDTSEIKNMIEGNLDGQQTDMTDVIDALNELSKNLSSVKGQITKLSNKVTEMNKKIDEGL